MKKGYRHITMNILMIIGILCVVYFVMYIVLVDLTNLFTYFWLIAGIGCIILRGLLIHMERNAIVLPARIKWTIRILACVAALVFVVVETIIIRYGATVPSPGADYVLVLGCQVKGTNPTYALTKRLDAAYDYLMDNPDTMVILSGGQGPGEDVTEAHAMAEYLTKKGFPETRMLLEDKSQNTDENIRYSMKLMESPNAAVVLVTNHFHVFRGVGVARKQGLTNVEGLGASTKWYTVPNQYVREAFAVLKYKLWGQI